jgi:putative ATP-dependent endonuclease of the OLD family
MTLVREIEINNFRSIRHLAWSPQIGVNCLIGPGDSGKSTILDAIDLTLGARRQAAFTDADFYGLNVDAPIAIKVTLGALDDSLKDIEAYGLYHHGRHPTTGIMEPEPRLGLETVLVVGLTVGSDLEPVWALQSDRANAQGLSRDLSWAHRTANAPTRLGPYAAQHFAWGPRSILNRLSEDRATTSSALAHAARSARQAFSDQAELQVVQTLAAVDAAAAELGVPIHDVQALLDIQGISFSGGSIAVHDADGVPLRNLGLGSARLLVAGMQHRASAAAQIALIDEVEHGLEPYRIVRLLHMVGSKQPNVARQVFMTTHSPVVLRELEASQLFVVRPPAAPAGRRAPVAQAVAEDAGAEARGQPALANHTVAPAGADEAAQATLRACAEAFLSPAVLICEGKTEIGLTRGLDLHYTDIDQTSMTALGVYPGDGGGDNTFQRALAFARLGYRTAIFRDADKAPVAADLAAATTHGIPIFQWEADNATENQIFSAVPADCIPQLLDVAVGRCGSAAVDAHIRNVSQGRFTFALCSDAFHDDMRMALGGAAKKYDWYKDMDPAEKIGRTVIGPNLARCAASLSGVLGRIRMWIEGNAARPGPER